MDSNLHSRPCAAGDRSCVGRDEVLLVLEGGIGLYGQQRVYPGIFATSDHRYADTRPRGPPLQVSLQVYDSCGGQLNDFTATMRVRNGTGESRISNVQGAGRKAIKTGGTTQLEASGGSPRNLLADDTPEFQIVGDLYPYFTIGTDGLTLRLEVGRR